MSRDWLFVEGNNLCDIRTVGVLIRDGKLLVQREREGNEFALPGGHVHIGETLADGLAREYREEIGADITCVKLLWSEECFCNWQGRDAHSFAFYFLVDDQRAIPDTGAFTPLMDNDNIVYGWLSVEEIPNVVIYPKFIQEEIHHLDETGKHFVTKE